MSKIHTRINVTTPLMPPLKEFIPYLEQIWDNKWLTNNGSYHQELENALGNYLGVKYISLFTNGTLALITAFQALRITGEVITTPFSFVATTHSLWWNGIKPVFVDVDPKTGNLDPNKIEAAITPNTTAILPVHVYGNPCESEKIQEIADKYGLKVIYDAAHAFGVKRNGTSILNDGDVSTLSFHATKTYNTIEGGAIVCHDLQTKQRIDFLKNFGFANEIEVVAPGINSKMDEVRAAFGLLNLKYVDDAIEHRKHIASLYRNHIKEIEGISLFEEKREIQYNYSYFPIFINQEKYGMSRNQLYEKLKTNNIFGRRYFYPLISSFSTYKGLRSASPGNLQNANILSDSVICLPMSAELSNEDVDYILKCL